jgi:acyl transferase domain-containing protein
MNPTEGVLSAARLALSIKRFREKTPDSGLLAADPVAIIGIGCRLPGDVRSPRDFWRVLKDGIDVITEVPKDRWSAEDYFDPDPMAAGKTNGRFGGFVSDPALFDPVLFGISPREAVSIDPQQRLLLEVAWEAIQDSGRAPESLTGSRTGVFAGLCLSDYERLLFEDQLAVNANTCTGAYHSVASGRISFLLDLRGPSVSIDTACSSSLTAIHAACQSLRSGESDLALAGGVTLHLLPEHYMGLARLGMLAPDGRCKTFDARGDGFVPSEGCGLVLLKRLSEALAEGDRIYAVIRGAATNQDGRTNSLTSPSGLAQQEVVRAALDNARVSPASISYVETHGTGTVLGDPIEVEALGAVLGPGGEGTRPCVLGAAKTNFGHLEAAAGVTGLIKAALALYHEEIPRNLHFEKLNPHISLEGSRFVIPTKTVPWPRGTASRFAGVSSFGFSGTNAHVVMEEAPYVPVRRAAEPQPGACVLLLSGRTPDALRDSARQYRHFLAGEAKDFPLYDICHSAALRRSHYEERLALTAATHAEMCGLLDDFLEGRSRFGIVHARMSQRPGSIGFVCSGQGSQWPRMGISLYAQEPVFRAALDECEEWIHRWAGWSLLERLSAPEAESKLGDTEYAQPAIFAIEVALARLLESWGIQPGCVIGHSAGEVAAAHISGVLSLEEAARVVVNRGRIMQPSTGHGKMAAVRLAAAAVVKELALHGNKVSIGAINSPQSTVISGDGEAVEALVNLWRERGVSCVTMPVNYAFHSAQMQPFNEELVAALGTVETRPEKFPLISTVLGRKASAAEFNAAYWGRNIRRTVQFAAAMEAASSLGAETFVEIGPHPVLLGSISECTDGRPGIAVSSLRKNQDERAALLSSLGALHVLGHPVAWKAVFREPAPPVALPPYPYQQQRFWVDQHPRAKKKHGHPLVGGRLRSPQIRGMAFESEITLSSLPYLAGHRIQEDTLFPMTAILEMVQQAAFETFGEVRTLIDITVLKPLPLAENAPATLQISIEGDGFKVHSLQGEEWVLHASGRADERVQPDGSCELGGPREFGTSAAFYSELRDLGAPFGPAFQTVRGLAVADLEAWTEVQLGEAEQRDAASYWVHPALLDGCLQTAVAARGHGDLFLPFAIDRFECFTRGSLEARAHARVKPSGSADVLSADIDVRREDGALVARISGLHMKRVEALNRQENIYTPEWQRTERGTPTKPATGTWSVAGGHGTAAAQLVASLRRCGVTAQENAADRHIVSQGLVFLVNGSDFAGTAGAVLSLAQGLLRQGSPEPPRLWLVTQGAENEGLFQSPVWGMARTIAMEHPQLNCVRVDLDPLAPDFEALAREIANWDEEEEIALREDGRYVRRLAKTAGPPEPRRWTVPARGSIDHLKLAALERRAPGPGEVEVEVETSALNFRDVLNVLGMYPGDAGNPGAEFCGTITRTGDGVEHYHVGDHVMGLALGSLASFVTTPVTLVTWVPKGWSSVEAATAPNVFLTVYHCLIHLGRLKRGERVLIHSAAGGVGLAAVQVAQHAGAEIFATAGSPQKREYLQSIGVTQIFDSRSLDFRDQISRATGGQGVDLVLNSLAGDFIEASFASLAERGRFVEIGKNQIWSQERVASLHREIEYFIVDLADEMRFEQGLVKSHLENLRALFDSGALRPLPARVFGFEDAPSAFRYMAQAKHMGKIVLRHPVRGRIRSDATYLITGGLGAIGLHVAQWLGQQGARNLVLVGRSRPGAHATEALDRLHQMGVRVEVRAADISFRPEVARTLDEIGRDLPPLAGVFHAAGVLDDGVFLEQTWERVEKVLAPKAMGAWYLHELTASKPLDLFVLFSSVASLTGSPGQSGYAAANAFLDALAHHRHALGMSALSVNWGAWAESGMAARVEHAGRRRVLPGIRAMSAQQCLSALETALAGDSPQVAIANADWSKWPATRFLSGLAHEAPRAPETYKAQPEDSGILGRMEAASPGNRRKVLIEYLRGQVNSLLGLNGAGLYIDERQSLLRMGMDSLMSVEFRNLLAGSLHRPLSATLLFDYPSIGDLADFLIGAPTPEDTRPSQDALLEELESLSDADAEELLKQELGQS